MNKKMKVFLRFLIIVWAVVMLPCSAAAAASDVGEMKVAYVKAGATLAVISLKDGSETLFPQKFGEIKSVSIVPGKDRIVVAGRLAGDNGIYVADIGTKQITPLFEKKSIVFNSPSFSPDGRLLAYTASQKDDPFQPADVMLYDTQAKTEKKVTNQSGESGGGIYYNYPRFSPDMGSIVCSAAHIPDVETPRYDAIFIVKITLSPRPAAEILTGGATSYNLEGERSGFKASVPSAVDDGRIGFLKIADTDFSLAFLDPARKNAVADASAAMDGLAMPSFSKDGKYVVFEAQDGDGASPSSIKLMDLSTGKISKIADNGEKPSF